LGHTVRRTSEGMPGEPALCQADVEWKAHKHEWGQTKEAEDPL
jgi:hypothetical protein